MNKIYKVSRTDKIGYDEYDSFVCIAENEDQAKNITMGSEYSWIKQSEINSLKVEEIGYSTLEPQIILGSYNAG